MSEQSEHLQALLAELGSGSDERAQQALEHLAEQGESVLPWLLRQLQSKQPDDRWWATAALSLIDHPRAREALRRSLKDPDPSVRQCAAFGLRRLPSEQAVPELLEALADSDRLLARLAADALAALGDAGLSPLTEALRNPNPAVRIEAARALASMNDPAAIPPLFAALDDASPLVVHWAEQGLERLGVGMTFFDPSKG